MGEIKCCIKFLNKVKVKKELKNSTTMVVISVEKIIYSMLTFHLKIFSKSLFFQKKFGLKFNDFVDQHRRYQSILPISN